MSYPVIGLCGRAGVGKDEIANVLVEKLGASKVAFAGPLKELAAKFFPLDNVYGPSHLRNDVVVVPTLETADGFKQFVADVTALVGQNGYVGPWCADMFAEYEWNGGLSVRYFLQQLGTNLARNMNPNIWVEKGVVAVNAALANGAPFVVVTDVRFRNEALAIKAMGGVLCKVESDSIDTGNDNHASESEQSTIPDFWFDVVINNDKSAGLGNLMRNVLTELNPTKVFTGADPAERIKGEMGLRMIDLYANQNMSYGGTSDD